MKPKNNSNTIINISAETRPLRQAQDRFIVGWLVIAQQAAILLFGGAMFGAAALAADATPPDGASVPPVFATVGKSVITQQDYDMAFAAAARAKFYHGKPPDAAVALLQREVGDKLVANVLLFHEAQRRGLKPDETLVNQQIEQLEQRYRDNEQWKQVRAQELPRITRQLKEGNMVRQLEKIVRDVPAASEKQLHEYYTAHPEKFTEPEQQRVAIILLRVDPSSPSEVWQQALKTGEDLTARLRGGADFAELAREHSGDSSAEKGGDMGYLHSGMLAEAAQEHINKLKPGDISDPIALMEGVAIFRLTERTQPKLNSFEDVNDRARNLWLTDQSETAWKNLIERLKNKTPVRVNELRYLPLPAPVENPAGKPAEQK